MVIHVEFDIKITGHNGIVLQSGGKNFEAKISSDGKQDKDTFLGIDFTEFLAEYLSTSGFFLREKLLNGYGSGKQKHHRGGKITRNGSSEPNEEIITDLLMDSELEYRIRIGNNKVLIGKIPLKLDADAISATGDDTLSASLVVEDAAVDVEREANIVASSVSKGESGHKNSSISYDKEDTNRIEESDSDEELDSLEASDRDEKIESVETSDEDEELHHLEASENDGEPDSMEAFINDRELDSMEAFDSDGELDSMEAFINDRELDSMEAFDIDGELDNMEAFDSDGELAVYKLLNYSMMKAIEKYEDIMFNVRQEDSSDMEPAVDE